MEQHIRHNKPTGMTKGEKIRSWNAIEQGLTLQSSPFSYVTFLKRAHNKIIAAILGILILGGGAATAYASNAKPGDILFPVAIAKEKTQILFAGSTEKKKALQVRFAQRRLAEVRELASLAESSEEDASSPNIAAGTPVTTSRESAKRKDRARHGAEVALRELHATRDILSHDENQDATNSVDDIISEVSAVSLHGGRGGKNRERRGKQNTPDESSTTTPSSQRQYDQKEDRGAKTETETHADDSEKNSDNAEVKTRSSRGRYEYKNETADGEVRFQTPASTDASGHEESDDEDR